MRTLLFLLAITWLAACQPSSQSGASDAASDAMESAADDTFLADLLAAQPDDVQARYVYRHPQETIEFFEIEPGMTVLEALPGGGWYTKILLPYLGSDGHLVGADYALEMYPLFGFFPEEFLEKKKTWISDWTAEAEEWRDGDSAPLSAFVFGSMPDAVDGTVDRVLFIRALHNLNRFESEGSFLATALADAFRSLKPGGIVGVVQHRAVEAKSDDWANGSKGYLKQSLVIEKMEQAGFEFIGGSGLNANRNDQPGEDDIVWRLPPTLQSSRDNPELQAEMEAIGESNRMTLKFRKPD